MRVSFKVNLGSQDAAKIGVDFQQCTVGNEVDCDLGAGKWLVANGIATEVVIPAPPAPEPVQVVVEEVAVVPVPEPQPEVVEPPVEPEPQPKPEPKTKKK